MENIYFYCAVVGGAFLVIQTLMLAFAGHAGDGDALGADPTDVADTHGLEHAADAQDSFLKVLSLKTLVGFATFFGLTGLGGTAAGWSPTGTLVAAILAGLVALYLVAWLMAALHRLQSSGTLNLRNAVGRHGKVYLRVPGQRGGAGRVTLTVQGRLVECKAVTQGNEIPTGAPVRVVAVDAEAEAQQIRIEAEAQAAATFVRLEAQARGDYEILAKKAEGLRRIVDSCGGAQQAFQMLMLEQLPALSETAAKAIANIRFDKIVVWDGGQGLNGKGATANFLQNLAHTLPPMLHMMRDVGGVEMPEFFGRLMGERGPVKDGAEPAQGDGAAAGPSAPKAGPKPGGRPDGKGT